ncbi:MAG: FAD-dependent oxidoreductase [Anaerolineaceae bacterium]
MTIQPIKYVPVDNLQAAEQLLKDNIGQAKVIAGGTDIMGILKDSVHADPPQMLIGLKPTAELNYVVFEPKGLRIGALTTLNIIAKNPTLRKTYPLLAQAAASVASPQIRNVATIAGNLCQEPRCWYYRNPDNTFDCLRKGGRWCDALFAENRYHSIYGGMCVSSAPCESGCPIHNNIPAYMAKLREGKVEEAVEILMRTNPLAAIMGRICAHNCEQECNRSDYDEAVSIRNVERYLGDFALAHSDSYFLVPEVETGKSVAVVGSGPAGLTAAYFLRKRGYQVTVYERMPEAGGMLRYSIPEYRLPKTILREQVKALQGMGIQFKFGASVGTKGLTLEDLQKEHQSVFLATGLWNGRQLRLDKSELLESGLDFLIKVQTGKQKPMGERVLVIGGGSVAVDVAVTAKRLGARQVTMVCLESLATMPAVPEDVVLAEEEGIRILPSWGPQRVIERDGKLSGMEFVRCTSVFDQEGYFAPAFDTEVKTIVEVDQVLVAIGQAADLSYLGPKVQTERGLISVEHGSTITRVEGVFAGGDVTGGVLTVVQGMADGINAAVSIDTYLSGSRIVETTNLPGLKPLVINQAALPSSSRVNTPRLPVSERALQKEDNGTFAFDAICEEVLRCANCGCVAVNASDVANALIALDAQVKTTKRSFAAAELFAATESKTTVLVDDELIEEIFIPTPQPESRQIYLKFRIRNTIDFPIVSVAFMASMREGRFHDARVVLGAVAPIPLRAKEVEKLLEDQVPSEALATKAADLAVKDAQPLGRNKAKIEIVKALVSKAIRTT